MVKKTKPAVSIDDHVKAAIKALLPGCTTPDEDNYRLDGTQYKAPDHASLDMRVLVERKSRTIVDGGRIFARLAQIGGRQDWRGGGYGVYRVDRFISDMPDPIVAHRSLADWLMNKTMKELGDARKKFEEHAALVNVRPMRCGSLLFQIILRSQAVTHGKRNLLAVKWEVAVAKMLPGLLTLWSHLKIHSSCLMSPIAIG